MEAVSRSRSWAALTAALTLTALTATPRPAGADDLVLRTKLDAPLVVGGGLAFVLSETLFKDALAPDACRWCATDGLDRAVRDGLRWDDPARAASASNLVGYLGVPLATIGGIGLAARMSGHGENWWTDGVIVAESAILASDFTNLVKDAVGRERPFVHALAPADKPLTASPQENNLSFFSGHSSLTMSLAVSAGTVATLRGYRLAPAVWAAGVGLALATGYLRIAGDRHWATDVVTGWAVGAAFGFAVPYYLHRRSHSSTASSLSAAVGPRLISVAFTW